MQTFGRRLAGEYARRVVRWLSHNPVAARLFFLKETYAIRSDIARKLFAHFIALKAGILL
jgi:hypothetical protein